jgi:hypothetical protein
VKFPKIERYRNVGRLVRYRNAITVEMWDERHTTRILNWLTVDWDAELLEKVTKKRWHVYEERPLRDIAELFSVARKVVNSDASRLEKIRELQKKHKRLIVFYNFDYELDILRSLGEDSSPNLTTNNSVRTSSPSSNMFLPVERLRWTDPERAGDVSSLPQRPSQRLGSTGEVSSKNSSGESTTETKEMKRLAAQSKLVSLEAKRKTKFKEVLPPTSNGETTTHPYQEEKDPNEAVRLWVDSIPSVSVKKSSHILTSTESKPSSDGHSLDSTSKTQQKSSSTLTVASCARCDGPSERAHDVCDSCEKGLGWGITVAEYNGHKHQPVPTTSEWIYLVQYRAGAEAWNCITTDTIVFYSMTYSYKDFEQSQGRIDRINTPFKDLYYYVLASDAWIDIAIQKSLNTKQDFNERKAEKELARLEVATEIVEEAERFFEKHERMAA